MGEQASTYRRVIVAYDGSDSAEDALSADVSFSMLANDAAAEAVLGTDAARAASGRIHVNMASISPDAADRLHEQFTTAGAAYLSAAVLGRPDVAAAGKLNILAAGDAAKREVVPHRPGCLLVAVTTFAGHIVRLERDGGLPRLRHGEAAPVERRPQRVPAHRAQA